MLILKRNILAGACLAALGWSAAAAAQEAPQGNTVLGPPQLRDFRLPGERRTAPVPPPDEPVIQPPRQQAPPPAAPRLTPAQPPNAEQQPRTQPQPQPRPAEEQPRAAPPTPPPATGPAVTPAPAPAQPAPADSAPVDTLPPPYTLPADGQTPAPTPGFEEAPVEPGGQDQGYPFWLFLVPVVLALVAGLAWRRRRSAAQAAATDEAAAPAAAPEPAPLRPQPKPRPWIELEFRPERASATMTEANVQFELIVRNTGGSAARNIRIETRMFNAGREQDKEIGAFFRRPAAEVTKSTLPLIEADGETSFRSVVTMAREAMRAVNVQGRTLFVPMVAFNVFYEWGEARRGQTSRSYVVGREPDQPAERMAPFRLDLGPRIYRTVGQREHSLARRV